MCDMSSELLDVVPQVPTRETRLRFALVLHLRRHDESFSHTSPTKTRGCNSRFHPGLHLSSFHFKTTMV